MRSQIEVSIIALVLMTTLAANILLVSFSATSAFAEKTEGKIKRSVPDSGVIGVSDSTANDCPVTTSVSSTKGGAYIKFKVPSTLTTIQNSGKPDTEAVNIHTSFIGEDGFYREVGLYYGDWRRASGIGYNKNVFQFAWGIADSGGGKLRGVIPMSVVAGHTVELWFVYFESQGKWAVLYDDLNASPSIQTIYVETSTVRVKSNYWVFIETSGATPTGNSNTLGLVEFLSVQKATRIAGDGVSLSQWTHGYSKPLCVFGNNSYGFTAISGSHFKMGYGGTFRNDDYAVW